MSIWNAKCVALLKKNWQMLEKFKYVERANNVTTFSGCGQILKADACEMRLYSQNMPNQLSTHKISGKYINWLVRYSPSKMEFYR